jgi:hypothetical protein
MVRGIMSLSLAITLLVAAGCSRYSLDKPEDRAANEEIAKTLREPLNAYRQDKGTYPETLALLLPNYVDELPSTKSGHPLQYRALEGEFMLFWYQTDSTGKVACSFNFQAPLTRETQPYESNDCFTPGKNVH